ncbi:MAG: glutaredoxin domain-containing protein [bacterium]
MKKLDASKVHSAAAKAMNEFHAGIVSEVERAVGEHDVVVVGMAQNPVVKKARKVLGAKGVQYHYIAHGSYSSKWKERLAIKLWSGWPTFPMVFIKGTLIGGCAELEALIASGEFDTMLA